MGKALNSNNLVTQSKIIFWDFDGVIKDSVSVKIESFCRLFESYGSEVEAKIKIHNETNGGMSRFDKIPLYLEWVGEKITQSRIDELCNEFSDLVLDGVINSDWIPGVENYLRTNQFGQVFIVVSATPKDELDIIIKKLGLSHVFYTVIGSPTSKKNGIKSILDSFNISPDETVMIGDSIADKNAADECKVPFLLKMNLFNKTLFRDYKGFAINDFTQL